MDLLNIVHFSCSVMSNSLWPHGLQRARLPCPSPAPGACSNSCPLNWWCHPTISSSVIPFFSCPQSFPASGSFPMSQFFTPGGQHIGASASASVLPVNIHDWFLTKRGPLEKVMANHFSILPWTVKHKETLLYHLDLMVTETEKNWFHFIEKRW